MDGRGFNNTRPGVLIILLIITWSPVSPPGSSEKCRCVALIRCTIGTGRSGRSDKTMWRVHHIGMWVLLGCTGSILTPSTLRLAACFPKPDTCAFAILRNEYDSGGFEGLPDCGKIVNARDSTPFFKISNGTKPEVCTSRQFALRPFDETACST
jgi:hypothetical protein